MPREEIQDPTPNQRDLVAAARDSAGMRPFLRRLPARESPVAAGVLPGRSMQDALMNRPKWERRVGEANRFGR